MNDVAPEGRQTLLRGALASVKLCKDEKEALRHISTWIMLEDVVGDKDFSFRIALTIPAACTYNVEQDQYISMLNTENAERILNRIRTTFFIRGTRTKKDVV